jgi:hypothetical protein
MKDISKMEKEKDMVHIIIEMEQFMKGNGIMIYPMATVYSILLIIVI